jgi:putative nucleotidyltransferase with HDIG domain
VYTVNIKDAAIGQIITEPIFGMTGALLCNPGTPVSVTLKRLLPRHGIQQIKVQPIVSDEFDTNHYAFRDMSNITYIGLKKLNINDVSRYANILINNLRENENSLILNMLYDYDEGTYTHSINVANLALTYAIKAGFDINELHSLACGSLLHDIGKMRVNFKILNKKGKLTVQEFNEMKLHPLYSYEILSDLPDNVPTIIKQIVLQHHENHDGTGYPRGLRDYHICKLARLVHVADCYEALCSRRPYKDALPRTMVRDFMVKEAGSKFDPIMLRKFLSVIPMYLIGEEIEFNGIKGVVIDEGDGENPLISVGKDIVRLTDFQNVKYARQKVYSECRDLIYAYGGDNSDTNVS